MKPLFKAILLTICFSLVSFSVAPIALADRGMLPISDVSVYGPGQKAIIAWDGEAEILILSTDVSASGDSQVLELLPLPSEPQVEKGDFASFEQIDKLLEKHFPIHWWDGFRKGELGPPGQGPEIIFHEKIGAHDITVVKAADSAELVRWAEEFLGQAGIEHEISSPKLESVVQSYIAQDINYFVFDLIEVTSEPKSIEPIVYRFDTDFLYYPLKISTLASGWTDINLFLLTPKPINLHWLPEGSELPQGMEIGRFYDSSRTQPIRFKVNKEELASINPDIAKLLGDSAWLTAVSYHGDLAGLTRDLKIYRSSPPPRLVFDCYQGECASDEESQAVVGIFGSTIVAYGVAITPTPCYELEAELDILASLNYPRTIFIDITAREEPGVCIECLGEVPFRAKVVGLAPGIYRVLVRYQGEVIGQRKVVLLPLSLSKLSWLPFRANTDIVLSLIPGGGQDYIDRKSTSAE